MSLSEYARILRRWGWVLLLAALVTAASAYVFSKLQDPIYRASVVISMTPSRPDLSTTQTSRTLLRNYVVRIDSDEFAQDVINLLQLDRRAPDLNSDVTVASDDSRFTIQIDVEDRDPDVAYDIAFAWSELVKSWRDAENANLRNEDKVNAAVVDSPKVALFRPNTRINVLAGAILGLLLGGLIVFAIEYVESGVIRSPEDVERSLSLAVLGAIPSAETGAVPAGRWRPGRR